MKTARLLSLLGSILLAGSAAFHTGGYPRFIVPVIEKEGIGWPTSGVLKALWLTFAILLFGLAVVVVLARNLERGGTIVLVIAAVNAACVAVMWRFLGFFPGVYLLTGVTILLGIGGALHLRLAGTEKPRQGTPA